MSLKHTFNLERSTILKFDESDKYKKNVPFICSFLDIMRQHTHRLIKPNRVITACHG